MKKLGHAYTFRISKCAGMSELIFGEPYKEQDCVVRACHLVQPLS